MGPRGKPDGRSDTSDREGHDSTVRCVPFVASQGAFVSGRPGSRAGRQPRPVLHGLSAGLLFVALVWGVHLVVAGAPAGAQAEERGETRADPAVLGETLWRRDCVSCHAPDGSGTRWGPDIRDKGAAGVHLAVTSGRMPIEDLADLRNPPEDEDRLQVPRGRPGRNDYLPGQVSALVAHAREILPGPDTPSVDVAGADVSRGADLFQVNCASCHAWSGRGGALTNGHEATSLEESTPQQVVEAMRTGLGTMPDFPETAVPDEEAADIAAYVEYLHHPRNPGGFPLAHLGPTAEGATAGVIGILGLLLFTRWIGKRS